MWPAVAFSHLGESFTPAVSVPDDHPMITARPDLFTADKPKPTTTPRKPKE